MGMVDIGHGGSQAGQEERLQAEQRNDRGQEPLPRQQHLHHEHGRGHQRNQPVSEFDGVIRHTFGLVGQAFEPDAWIRSSSSVRLESLTFGAQQSG